VPLLQPGGAHPAADRAELRQGRAHRLEAPAARLPPQAFPAAEAAEAAREQGKFWQMHDLLFANQSQLSQAQYEALAKQLGLEQAKFKAALESRRNKAASTRT